MSNSPVDILIRHRKSAAVAGLFLLAGLAIVTDIPSVDGTLDGFEIPGNPHRAIAAQLGESFQPPPVLQIEVTPAAATLESLLAGLRGLDSALVSLAPGSETTSIHSFASALAVLGIEAGAGIDDALQAIAEIPLAGGLVSGDRKSFLVLVSAPPGVRLQPEAVDDVLAARLAPYASYRVFGLGHLEAAVRDAIAHDIVTLTAFITILTVAFLVWSYGSLKALLFVGCLTGASVLAALASISMLSLRLNVATMLVLPTITVLSLSDAVHLITGYTTPEAGRDAGERVQFAVRRYVVPSFLTSLTTAGAFLSLLTTEARNLRELGLAVGSAVMLAFALAYLLGPQLLVSLNITSHHNSRLVSALGTVGEHPAKIGLPTLGLIVVAPFVLPYLNFSTPPEHFFPRGSEVTAVHDSLTSRYFSLASLDVILQARSDPTREVALSEVVDITAEITEQIEAEPEVVLVGSIGRIVAQARMLNLPFEPLAAQLRRNPYISLDGRMSRIEIRVADGAVIPALARSIEDILGPYADRVTWQITSPLLALEYVNERVAAGLARSFLVSALFVILIVGVLTRSTRGTVIAALANAVPIGAAICLFGLMRLELSVLSAAVLVLCLGLVVDDTLHALYRLAGEEGRLGELSYGMATTSLLLGAGFSVFLLSSFEPIRILGGVMAVVLLVALIADLTLVPLLFSKWPAASRRG